MFRDQSCGFKIICSISAPSAGNSLANIKEQCLYQGGTGKQFRNRFYNHWKNRFGNLFGKRSGTYVEPIFEPFMTRKASLDTCRMSLGKERFWKGFILRWWVGSAGGHIFQTPLYLWTRESTHYVVLAFYSTASPKRKVSKHDDAGDGRAEAQVGHFSGMVTRRPQFGCWDLQIQILGEGFFQRDFPVAVSSLLKARRSC